MAKVLIIEDNSMIARIWRFQLEKAGHEIMVASTGPEALELVGTAKPDIMLVDIMLPGMNGFEVLEKLGEKEDTKDIPSIVLSAVSSYKYKERAYSLGAYKYIVKSDCTPQQLLQTVEAALNNNHSKINH